MKIKLCGIRRMEDIVLMNEFSPDYIGFVFAKSKRQITRETAARLSEELYKSIKTVGVFVDEPFESLIETVRLSKLDVVQLHGEEDKNCILSIKKALPNTEVWKAIRVKTVNNIKDAEKLGADMLLLDSFSEQANGGTGNVANISAIKEADLKHNYFLAGGLNGGNIDEIVKEVNPYGVDISSGIEVNGFKDRDKIIEIMRCLKCLK